MFEEFKILSEFPNYSISSLGRIRRDTSSTNTIAGRFLKPTLCKRNGYQLVSLMNTEKKAIQTPVHQLVCVAFNGLPPSIDHQVGHYDGNPANNKSANLRWVTVKENSDDRDRHGRTLYGSKSPGAKLTEDQVIQIKHFYAKGIRLTDLAEQFLVSISTISDIISGRTWKRFTKQYESQKVEKLSS